VLGIAGIDQHHLETALLKDLVGRNPVDAGGLHGDRPHSAALEPIGQALQITGAGAEGAHRLAVPIRRDCRDVHPCTDIDCRRIGMGRHEVSLRARPLRLGHDTSSQSSGGAGLRREINFLTGIAATASPLASPQQPMGHVF
jgi:hypothetical protein